MGTIVSVAGGTVYVTTTGCFGSKSLPMVLRSKHQIHGLITRTLGKSIVQMLRIPLDSTVTRSGSATPNQSVVSHFSLSMTLKQSNRTVGLERGTRGSGRSVRRPNSGIIHPEHEQPKTVG